MRPRLRAVCLACALLPSGVAQAGGNVRVESDVTVFTPDIDAAKARIDAFVNEASAKVNISESRTEGQPESGPAEALASSFRVESKSEARNSYTISLSLPDAEFRRFNALLPTLGHVASSNLRSIDNGDNLERDSIEIAFQRENKRAYEKELARADSLKDQADHAALWKELRGVERTLYDLEKNLQALRNARAGNRVNLQIREEETSPGEARISFVNMPGVEYGLIRIENPEKGFSASLYQGVSLKYLLTRGKTFALIGAYHNSDAIPRADSTTISELFFVSVGQDFYSRHFGRGANRFFNLYTGYTAGSAFATGEASSRWFLHVDPYLGLELFKNKYALLDNKVGYLIPLLYNRKLRGLSYCASFNFVF